MSTYAFRYRPHQVKYLISNSVGQPRRVSAVRPPPVHVRTPRSQATCPKDSMPYLHLVRYVERVCMDVLARDKPRPKVNAGGQQEP